MSGRARVPTAAEVRRWPVTVDVVTAGRCFGLGRDASYRAAADKSLPVPVLRLGRRLLVTRAALLDALGIDEATTPDKSLARPALSLFSDPTSLNAREGGAAA
jgi:hypothetical protein